MNNVRNDVAKLLGNFNLNSSINNNDNEYNINFNPSNYKL